MRVLNKWKEDWPVGAVNIMRPGLFGNPYQVGRDGDRDEVLKKHLDYLRKRIEFDQEFKLSVKQLFGHDLVCICKPFNCHGDNLKLVCEELNGTQAE